MHGLKVTFLIQSSSFKISENSRADLKYVTCAVPQGSILGPLLFLVYVNDLPNAFCLLDSIMLADDTNLFFNHKDIKYLFTVVNKEPYVGKETRGFLWGPCKILSIY